MTVANLKIGKRTFVVVPERDFDRMQQENRRYQQLLAEDHALGQLAEKELKAFRKSGSKGIPWNQIKKSWGDEMPHEVIFTETARRSLLDLPAHIQKRVQRWIDLIAEDPRRTGTRQLEGHPAIRRVHASKDYVILYTIEKDRIAIIILRVENRREVYRRL